MSKIEKELQKATGVEPKRGEEAHEYVGRLLKEVNKLNNEQWAALSKDAQNWFNESVDARTNKADKNAATAVVPFPDAAAQEEEAPRRRRRADDDEPAGAGQADPKAGDRVKVVTKRGKEYEGVIEEIDSEIVAIVADGEKEADEFDLAKVESITVLEVAGAGAQAEEPGPWEPTVGAQVKLITKRGKEYEGEVTEISEDIIVLKGADGEDEFDFDKVASVEPLGGGAAEEPETRRRAPAADKDDAPARRASPAGDAKGDEKPKRSSNPRGTSVGNRIREIMADDLAISEADVGKILKKEGLEFRDTTLNMIYKDTSLVIELLKKNKKLK